MKIVNLVCSGDFHTRIDLDHLNTLGNPSFTYSRRKYPGGYFQTSYGKVTIYSTGKYIIYGLKSFEEIGPAFQEVCDFLSPHVPVSDASPPQVQNVVGLEEYPGPVDLNTLISSMQFEQCEYEPEQFPGLVVHLQECTALVFSSGKVVLTGGKSVEGLERCWRGLKEKISRV